MTIARPQDKPSDARRPVRRLRLARFTREAQILASLNHPNIAAIHGLDSNSMS